MIIVDDYWYDLYEGDVDSRDKVIDDDDDE